MPIDFDGTDDSVDCGLDSSLQVQNFTIAAWVRPQATKSIGLVATAASGGLNGYRLGLNASNKVVCLLGNGSGIDLALSSASLSQNVDYHVAITASDSALKVYINGIEDTATPTARTKVLSYANNLRIGTHSDLIGGFFDGIISEVAIWKEALTDDDIYRLYRSGIKGTPLYTQSYDLVGYWPMDDGQDGRSADGDTVRDLSGNGNDGTGDDGAGNTGLTWKAEEILSYSYTDNLQFYHPIGTVIDVTEFSISSSLNGDPPFPIETSVFGSIVDFQGNALPGVTVEVSPFNGLTVFDGDNISSYIDVSPFSVLAGENGDPPQPIEADPLSVLEQMLGDLVSSFVDISPLDANVSIDGLQPYPIDASIFSGFVSMEAEETSFSPEEPTIITITTSPFLANVLIEGGDGPQPISVSPLTSTVSIAGDQAAIYIATSAFNVNELMDGDQPSPIEADAFIASVLMSGGETALTIDANAFESITSMDGIPPFPIEADIFEGLTFMEASEDNDEYLMIRHKMRAGVKTPVLRFN